MLLVSTLTPRAVEARATEPPLLSAEADSSADGAAVLASLIVLSTRAHAAALAQACAGGHPRAECNAALAGACDHVYDSALAGASGRFGPAQMAAVEACLGDGALAYAEPDGGVVKQERGTRRRWWEAARAAAAADGEEEDTADGEGEDTADGEDFEVSASGRVEAFDAAASGGEPPRVRRSQDDAQRLLAAVGREAQRELSRAPLRTEEAVAPRLQATDGAAGGGGGSAGSQQQRLPAALWSLDRIDQRALPRDGLFSLGAGGGEGVTIYSVDSGVYFAHQEFLDFATGERRASSGPDFVDSDADASDCDGHGTHTAATAAGRSTGVAKRAKVVAVRVLDCEGSGSIANTVAGLDWCACARAGCFGKVGKGGRRRRLLASLTVTTAAPPCPST